MKKIKENIDLKKLLVSILLVIVLVVQIALLSYLLKAVLPEKNEDTEENVVMKYTSKGNFNYLVYLKENEFIKEPYLKEGEAYILDLVDFIRINANYNFNATEKTDVNGTSRLVARLKIYYKESSDKGSNPEVLKKEEVLKEEVVNFSNKTHQTSYSHDIYLTDYINTLMAFRERVKVSLEGYLEISLENNYKGVVGGASYTSDYTNTLKIPLSNSVFKIEGASGEEKTEKVYEGDLIKTNKTVRSYIIIANVVTFTILLLLLKKLFMFTNKSEYEKTINKLLRNYDDVIVNTTSILDIGKYKLIEINEFKEILNLSRELLLPIMNYEVEKGRETWLYVIKDDILYRYVISLENLEGNKKEKKNKIIK